MTSYVYGADGARLKKTEGGNTTATFGPVEIRKFGQGSAEEIVTYPHANVRLVNGAASYMQRSACLGLSHLDRCRAESQAHDL